jgi:hypothetical protein
MSKVHGWYLDYLSKSAFGADASTCRDVTRMLYAAEFTSVSEVPESADTVRKELESFESLKKEVSREIMLTLNESRNGSSTKKRRKRNPKRKTKKKRTRRKITRTRKTRRKIKITITRKIKRKTRREKTRKRTNRKTRKKKTQFMSF